MLSAAVAISLVGLAGIVSADAATVNPRASSRWRGCQTRLDGVTTKVATSQRTVTIVNQTSRTHARVSFWVRTDSRCAFTRKFLTRSGRIGYGGTVRGDRRKQGTGTTPLGTYSMTQSFGNGAAPAGRLPYHRVIRGDYWVGDNDSRFYNTLRNRSQGGFRWRLPRSRTNASEYLPRFGAQYRYVVVINFNRAPLATVRYRGFGIFLHVKSSKATGGCVAITARQMRTVMAYLKPGDRITISR